MRTGNTRSLRAPVMTRERRSSAGRKGIDLALAPDPHASIGTVYLLSGFADKLGDENTAFWPLAQRRDVPSRDRQSRGFQNLRKTFREIPPDLESSILLFQNGFAIGALVVIASKVTLPLAVDFDSLRSEIKTSVAPDLAR